MSSMGEIDGRVREGAAWLDENRPGWVDAINLDTLEMRHGRVCLLAQAYGAPYWTLMKCGCRCPICVPTGEGEVREDPLMAPEEAVARGFVNADADLFDSEYPALRLAWTQLIEARRGNDQPPIIPQPEPKPGLA